MFCENCGHKKKNLKLSERVFECSVCNLKLDRDFNAAKNLSNLSLLNKKQKSGVVRPFLEKAKCLTSLSTVKYAFVEERRNS